MGVDVRILGANQLGDLAQDLKVLGEKELRKELLRGIQKAGTPLKVAARAAALKGLPSEGGLNEFVASSRFAVRTRTGSRNPGIRLTGTKKGHDIRAMDRGRLRHPVYGRDVWVTQTIRPGWWTEGLSDPLVLAPVQREVLKVLDDVVRRLARG